MPTEAAHISANFFSSISILTLISCICASFSLASFSSSGSLSLFLPLAALPLDPRRSHSELIEPALSNDESPNDASPSALYLRSSLASRAANRASTAASTALGGGADAP